LKSGETKEVKFQIDESILSFYDVESKNFKAEPGQFKIHIGSASDDIRLTTEFELSKEN
jgi:beta-glucosidase